MNINGSRIVVSGGSGFIGSHLVKRLLEEGARVAVLVRYGNVVKCERLRWCWDRIHVIEADLRNRGALEAVRGFQPDIVFHLAAYNHVGQSFQQVEECFDVNAKGSANLFDLTEGAARFIYISSSEVYGHQDAVPFTETMEPQPLSPYAITKYAGELYCRMKQRIEAQPRTVILRPFNAYGPYQSSKAIIPELILKCLRGLPIECTEGKQTREFNYVEDLVDGLIKAATATAPIDGPVNLAAGQEIAIRDLVQLIARLTETKSELRIGALPYRPTEIWRMRGDHARAKELLGWQPSTSMEDGLRKTIEWFRGHRIQEDAAPGGARMGSI
jgi:UDP-glucose 4-epimerase